LILGTGSLPRRRIEQIEDDDGESQLPGVVEGNI
jgi:hypothetical protein